jgi:phage protein U
MAGGAGNGAIAAEARVEEDALAQAAAAGSPLNLLDGSGANGGRFPSQSDCNVATSSSVHVERGQNV